MAPPEARGALDALGTPLQRFLPLLLLTRCLAIAFHYSIPYPYNRRTDAALVLLVLFGASRYHFRSTFRRLQWRDLVTRSMTVVPRSLLVLSFGLLSARVAVGSLVTNVLYFVAGILPDSQIMSIMSARQSYKYLIISYDVAAYSLISPSILVDIVSVLLVEVCGKGFAEIVSQDTGSDALPSHFPATLVCRFLNLAGYGWAMRVEALKEFALNWILMLSAAVIIHRAVAPYLRLPPFLATVFSVAILRKYITRSERGSPSIEPARTAKTINAVLVTRILMQITHHALYAIARVANQWSGWAAASYQYKRDWVAFIDLRYYSFTSWFLVFCVARVVALQYFDAFLRYVGSFWTSIERMFYIDAEDKEPGQPFPSTAVDLSCLYFCRLLGVEYGSLLPTCGNLVLHYAVHKLIFSPILATFGLGASLGPATHLFLALAFIELHDSSLIQKILEQTENMYLRMLCINSLQSASLYCLRGVFQPFLHHRLLLSVQNFPQLAGYSDTEQLLASHLSAVGASAAVLPWANILSLFLAHRFLDAWSTLIVQQALREAWDGTFYETFDPPKELLPRFCHRFLIFFGCEALPEFIRYKPGTQRENRRHLSESPSFLLVAYSVLCLCVSAFLATVDVHILSKYHGRIPNGPWPVPLLLATVIWSQAAASPRRSSRLERDVHILTSFASFTFIAFSTSAVCNILQLVPYRNISCESFVKSLRAFFWIKPAETDLDLTSLNLLVSCTLYCLPMPLIALKFSKVLANLTSRPVSGIASPRAFGDLVVDYAVRLGGGLWGLAGSEMGFGALNVPHPALYWVLFCVSAIVASCYTYSADSTSWKYPAACVSAIVILPTFGTEWYQRIVRLPSLRFVLEVIVLQALHFVVIDAFLLILGGVSQTHGATIVSLLPKFLYPPAILLTQHNQARALGRSVLHIFGYLVSAGVTLLMNFAQGSGADEYRDDAVSDSAAAPQPAADESGTGRQGAVAGTPKPKPKAAGAGSKDLQQLLMDWRMSAGDSRLRPAISRALSDKLKAMVAAASAKSRAKAARLFIPEVPVLAELLSDPVLRSDAIAYFKSSRQGMVMIGRFQDLSLEATISCPSGEAFVLILLPMWLDLRSPRPDWRRVVASLPGPPAAGAPKTVSAAANNTVAPLFWRKIGGFLVDPRPVPSAEPAPPPGSGLQLLPPKALHFLSLNLAAHLILSTKALEAMFDILSDDPDGVWSGIQKDIRYPNIRAAQIGERRAIRNGARPLLRRCMDWIADVSRVATGRDAAALRRFVPYLSAHVTQVIAFFMAYIRLIDEVSPPSEKAQVRPRGGSMGPQGDDSDAIEVRRERNKVKGAMRNARALLLDFEAVLGN